LTTTDGISASTVQRLKSAGWTRDRAIDVKWMEAALRGEGYVVFDSVAKFLTAFGELRIAYQNYRDATVPDGCHFDAARAAEHVFREQVSYWSTLTDKELCPIGEAFNEHMTVVMAKDGSVYAGYDDHLVQLGRTGTEAIEALCTGREPIPLT
jgi:hypothetical protein